MSTILVALDNSPRARQVLVRAVALAKSSSEKLHVLQAVGLPPDLPPELLGLSPDVIPERLVEAARKDLEALVAEHAPRTEAVIETRIGTPWRTICATAKELGASTVVIGTHGHTVLDTLLGTTAARVVNHAPCSVLVVRHAEA